MYKSDNEIYLTYLDDLRESGTVNMFGSAPYLQEEFDLDRNEARKVVAEWMRTYEVRHKVAA